MKGQHGDNDCFGYPLSSTLAVLLDRAFKRNGVGLKYFSVSSIQGEGRVY